MADLHLLTALLAMGYGLLAAIDGLWLHLWRYRLHLHAPREHAIHTVRALLFPAVVLLLMMGWATGPLLWCGAVLAAVDLGLVARDAAMETRSRDFQHGLPAGEAALHTLLQALHAAVLVCAIAARPWSAWTMTPAPEPAPGALAQMLFTMVLIVSILVALLHVWLWARGPGRSGNCELRAASSESASGVLPLRHEQRSSTPGVMVFPGGPGPA